MKVKTGIDSVEIERIKRAMETPGFLKRVLSDEEYKYYESKAFKAESVAGAWCAKEAFAKAMGQGVRGFSLNEIGVLHDELGKPYYNLTGAAKELAEDKNVVSLDLSITHDRTRAMAVATALT
ncbi:MAG: holo-ACP synthase, partial [Clostridia bacterium]|nr:holo-ACP synthase [Clostridia bacterium]